MTDAALVEHVQIAESIGAVLRSSFGPTALDKLLVRRPRGRSIVLLAVVRARD
jgi:hypothetical protein